MKERQSFSDKQLSPSSSLIDDFRIFEANDCFDHGSPICLEKGLLELYGPKGKKVLDSIVLNETFESAEITSPVDLAKFYDEYMDRLSGILGNNVCRVVDLIAFRMKSNCSCNNCPLAVSTKPLSPPSQSLEPIATSMFAT